MLDRPNIFNIPANYHFFDSLFYWLQKNFSGDFSQVKIFLPNRRSCRQLQEMFAKQNLSVFLPKIKAISDISYEDFFDFLPDSEARKNIDELLQINLIDGIDYLFFLSEEIQKLSVFGKDLEFDQAFKIAIHLRDLFDEIERAEIDLKKLDEIDDSDLSQHRLLTLDFLKNFHIQIKNSLLKKNIFFPVSYQNFIIQKFIQLLEKHGSKSPLVVAGSTGSVLFGRKLIRAISQQKNGFVILHGVNEENFEEENHPQFFLNELVKFLEVEKKSIKEINEEKFLLSSQTRQNLLSLMMLPSEQTIKWQKNDFAFDLDNFRLIEAKNEIEEAKIITLILEDNRAQNKNAALITNNDRLATLVKSELKNRFLPFNDSRNLDVFSSKLVNFLLLILELKENDFDSHSLLALLKHPLCSFSQDQKLLADFEIKILREERFESGAAGILKKIQDPNLKELFSWILKQVQDDDIIKSTENLSKKSWQELLETEPAQIELFEFFEKLKAQKITLNSSLLKTLLSQISYFEMSDATAPIQILSTIEARLLNYDLVVIASLNEGDFPQIEGDNWLGKKIKKDLGIERTLKKIGQNAYDFCNYLSNKSVVLTRSQSRNGAVLIESAFLLKFKTICQKNGINFDSGEKYFAQLKKINSPALKQIEAPNPKPKKEFRPQKISITDISKLISDPYAIYAKKILQLSELKKIDFEPSYAEFGSFIHKALEEFVKTGQQDFSKIFEQYFSSAEAKLIWWPKFENIFANFLLENQKFLNSQNHVEIPVKLSLGEVLISGKIDRVILDEEGFADIFDYKTGTLPTAKSVNSGINPQLTISALALVEGMIEAQLKNISADKISSLNYWKLSSSSSSEIKKICAKNEEIAILISAAKTGLERLFEFFADEENGYIATSTNDKSEYKNLERAQEWNK